MKRALEVAARSLKITALVVGLLLFVYIGAGLLGAGELITGLFRDRPAGAGPAVETAETVEVPWPQLSAEQADRASAIAFTDARVEQLLAGSGYTVEAIWPMRAHGWAPVEPFDEVWMNLTLDQAREITFAWPWPPDNQWRLANRPYPQQRTGIVRSISIVVSLAEGRVRGISDSRQYAPASYTRSLGAVNLPPPLTEDEKDRVAQIVFDHPIIQDLVKGRVFYHGEVGLFGRGLVKIGGTLTLYFDEPVQMDYDWPYDDALGRFAGIFRLPGEYNAVAALVNLEEGRVVAMQPDTLTRKVVGNGEPWPAQKYGKGASYEAA